jgi:arginine/serine-rich splicing factor 7
MSKNSIIFIGKLSSRAHTSDIEDQFSKYGRIKDIDFRKDRGFAFVEFSHREDAKYAIKKMDGRYFKSNRVIVEFKGNL